MAVTVLITLQFVAVRGGSGEKREQWPFYTVLGPFKRISEVRTAETPELIFLFLFGFCLLL